MYDLHVPVDDPDCEHLPIWIQLAILVIICLPSPRDSSDSILKVLCSNINRFSTAVLQVQALCCFYIVLDFIRESALSFRCLQKNVESLRIMTVVMKPAYRCLPLRYVVRHSHSLSIAFVLLCLLPVWTPANSRFGIDRNVLVMRDPTVRLHC